MKEINDQPITVLLQKAHDGDKQALNELYPHIYSELKKIARYSFKNENPGHTLQPTALLNEAFEKIVNADVNWNDRHHFYALSAQVMRRVLVDHAKAKSAKKRGGNSLHTSFNDQQIAGLESNEQLLAFDQAIEILKKQDIRKAKIVELAYFGGLNFREIASYLDISKATVSRDLKMAEAWLKLQVSVR